MAQPSTLVAGLDMAAHRSMANLSGERISIATNRGEAVDGADEDGQGATSGDPALRAGISALADVGRRRAPRADRVSLSALVVAVPLNDWRQPGHVQQLRLTLTREHICEFNNSEQAPTQLLLNDVQVLPAGFAALFSQVYGVTGDGRISVINERLLNTPVGVVTVSRASVTLLPFGKALSFSEGFCQSYAAAGDRAALVNQVSSLITEHRHLLDLRTFLVVGEGAIGLTAADFASSIKPELSAEPEWADADGLHLFAVMRLRQLSGATPSGRGDRFGQTG